MKMKFFWMWAAAVVLGFTACSDDDDEAAVGITAGTITPAGSSITYQLKAAGNNVLDNKDDSVAWDVTDAALKEAVLKVTPTLDATVFYNGDEVTEEGIVVDATVPITVTAMKDKKTVICTINVFRAQEAVEGLTKKATLVSNKVVWRDAAYWKNKFWLFTVTNEITDPEAGTALEKYVLSSSLDGINFTTVDYKITNVEDEVLGGEGARLIPLGDKLYVLNGWRSLGTDIYGNEPEFMVGYLGRVAAPSTWCGFVTSDGENFESLAEKVSIVQGEMELPASILYLYNNAYGQTVAFKGNIYQFGGFLSSFGMVQVARNVMRSADGTNWMLLSPKDAEGASIGLPHLGSEVFVLNDKLFLINGFTNFVAASQANRTVFCSSDGETWEAVDEIKGIDCIYQGRVVSDGKIAYLIGGEILGEDGTRTLNDKIYKSTDGIKWTEVETPSSFVGTRFPSAVTVGSIVWLYGGTTSVSEGSYADYKGSETYSGDVWNTLLK